MDCSHYASDVRNRKIVKMLESKMETMNTPDKDGTTPLILAAKVCDRETLADFLSTIDKDKTFDELSRALVYAASWDEDYDYETTDEECLKTTKLIIEYQPKVIESGGLNALKMALSDGHVKTAQFLIDQGIDINSKDEDGQTLLMHSVDCRSPASVKLLLSLGVDQIVKDNEGQTALDLAKKISKIAPKDASPQKVLSLLQIETD